MRKNPKHNTKRSILQKQSIQPPIENFDKNNHEEEENEILLSFNSILKDNYIDEIITKRLKEQRLISNIILSNNSKKREKEIEKTYINRNFKHNTNKIKL